VGPLSGSVRARAAKLGVGDLIELPGFIPYGEELRERYRRAHAFIHISLTEGQPQVIFEAMGSGLPIVATDVGGVRDALEEGRAGLLVPPDDPESLVAAIERLAADRDLRDRLASRALELAARVTIESESARVAAFIRGDAGTT
jgi:glycosyltransferase involved in cell wall biosynthesis